MIGAEELLEMIYRFNFNKLNLSSDQSSYISDLYYYMFSETMPEVYTKRVFELLAFSKCLNTFRNYFLFGF